MVDPLGTTNLEATQTIDQRSTMTNLELTVQSLSLQKLNAATRGWPGPHFQPAVAQSPGVFSKRFQCPED